MDGKRLKRYNTVWKQAKPRSVILGCTPGDNSRKKRKEKGSYCKARQEAPLKRGGTAETS